jgi:ribokinase
MVGRVGRDAYGEALVNNLVNEGVNIDCVSKDEKRATGIAMISVDSQGQNSIAVASGANFTLTKDLIRKAWEQIGDVDILIMPLETPADIILEAAKHAKDRNAQVVLNPAPARVLERELLSLVDVLVPNEHEIFQISNQLSLEGKEVETIAREMISQGAASVVTTLGSDGVSIVDRDVEEVRLSPYPVDVIDTTAAGDAFVAALAVSLSEGRTLVDSCHFANVVGALTVTKKGAQPSLPTRIEVANVLVHQEAK